MNKKIISILAFALAIIHWSCGIKTVTLANGTTRVPKDNRVFSDKSLFNKNAFSQAAENYFFEELDPNIKILKRNDTISARKVYGAYVFHDGGRLNLFTLYKGAALTARDFNPEYNGYRGSYYQSGNNIYFELFAEITDNRSIGKITGTMNFSGDTLIVTRNDLRYSEYYLRNTSKLLIEKQGPLW